MKKNQPFDFCYKPKVFLRCHSKNDQDTADVRTKIWQLSFEPTNTSSTIATVGGNKVCVINLDTGKVEQRYSAKVSEIFFALAWSPLLLDDQQENIIIVGGKLAVLHFIWPKNHIQIVEFPISNRSKKFEISSIIFYEKNANSFFCATNSGDIYLFFVYLSVGSDSKIETITSLSCETEIVQIAICNYSNTLFAATNSGLYGWNLGAESNKQWNDTMITYYVQGDSNSKIESDDIVDSVEILNDGFVASKYGFHEFIYIWHVKDSIVEHRSESKILVILPLYKLIWFNDGDCYMHLSANCDLGLLTCGDASGSIYLYDIRCIKTSRKGRKNNTEILEAVKIIKWPMVNDVDYIKSKKLSLETYPIILGKAVLSHDGKHLAAITHRNTVCLWAKNNS